MSQDTVDPRRVTGFLQRHAVSCYLPPSFRESHREVRKLERKRSLYVAGTALLPEEQIEAEDSVRAGIVVAQQSFRPYLRILVSHNGDVLLLSIQVLHASACSLTS